jgi:3-methyl-2-oxobutanoate hydroxymethyltransferase
LSIPTIGIGAGPGCDAQVMVWQDLAGLTPNAPKFAKRYADTAGVLTKAVQAFAEEVSGGVYPSPEYSYR